MREEYELEVLEKYDIEVKSTRRIRGAFFCIGSELKSGRAGDFGDCLQSRSVPFGAAGLRYERKADAAQRDKTVRAARPFFI